MTGDGAGGGAVSGLGGTVVAGGGDDGVEAFGRDTLAADVGCELTGVSGVATAPGGVDVVPPGVCRRVCGTVGA